MWSYVPKMYDFFSEHGVCWLRIVLMLTSCVLQRKSVLLCWLMWALTLLSLCQFPLVLWHSWLSYGKCIQHTKSSWNFCVLSIARSNQWRKENWTRWERENINTQGMLFSQLWISVDNGINQINTECVHWLFEGAVGIQWDSHSVEGLMYRYLASAKRVQVEEITRRFCIRFCIQHQLEKYAAG